MDSSSAVNYLWCLETIMLCPPGEQGPLRPNSKIQHTGEHEEISRAKVRSAVQHSSPQPDFQSQKCKEVGEQFRLPQNNRPSTTPVLLLNSRKCQTVQRIPAHSSTQASLQMLQQLELQRSPSFRPHMKPQHDKQIQ